MNDALEAALVLPSWRVERILYDRAGLLIVDKPAQIPVHGGDESLEFSLVDRLRAWLRAEGRPETLGVHSRLDQATSGLILFTTDEGRNVEIARAFETHAIRRVYRAVVGLSPRARLQKSGRIELSLEQRKDRVEIVQRGGKRAVTEYRVIERRGSRALLELVLETGRMHQIRASLAHLGAPILGDRLYGGEPASRLFLHARRLEGGPLTQSVEQPEPSSFLAQLSIESARAPRGERREEESGSVEIVAPLSPLEFRHRFLDAVVHRAPLTDSTAALRLVNSEGDGLPGLVVDAYGKFATVSVYEAPWFDHLPAMAELLAGLGFRGGYLKRRVRADLRAEDAGELAPDQVFFGEPAPSELVVEELGAKIAVSLADGLSTGLFIDARENRKRMRSWLSSGRFLNLFCYTSSFSVVAALSGAQTVSVDLSGRAIQRSKRNFELNGLDCASHSFFKEDAMKYLARAVRRGERFDFILLDPPSFATVGKGTFSVKARYREAAAQCFRLLAPGGRLLAVTNHTKTPLSVFRKMLSQAAVDAGRELTSLKDLTSGLDCPDGAFGSWPSKSALVTVS